MAMTVNTNIASLNAQRNLIGSQSLLNKSLQRLSSGLRINSAKDDAAGLAISDRMTSQIRGLNQAARNANDGISLAQTAEGALQEITNIAQRMRELAVQSANTTNTESDRQSLNAEFQSLMEEMNRIADTTSFNGQKVLDGSMGSSAQFQVGSEVGDTVTVDMGTSMETASIGNYVTQVFSLAVDSTVTDGDTYTLDNNADMDINGIDIDAATAGSNGQGAGSAKSVAEAINAKTSDTGVTAEAGVTTKSVSSTDIQSFGSWNDASTDSTLTYTLEINGVTIETKAEDDSGTSVNNLASKINAVSSTTGVVAQVEDDGGMTLSAADGRNIEIKETLGGANETDSVKGYFGHSMVNGTNADNYDISKADLTLTSAKDVKLDFTIANDADELFGLSGTATKTYSTQALNTSDILTVANSENAIYRLDQAIKDIDAFRGDLGAVQNRFESTIASLNNVAENISAARSRILDADFAAETASLTKAQILQQAGTAMLAQANTVPQAALTLLQG
ncbi:MAG: flagellin [Desulfobacteraceae bacterium]|jgi:flagellin